MSIDPVEERPLQCLDCGLLLQPSEAHSLMSYGAVVYPLCADHYQRRIDTIEGNP